MVTKMFPEINERMMIKYERLKGQIYLDMPIVCKAGSVDRIIFLYDTGAYITVINKELYEKYGLNKLPRKEVTLGGYVGKASGYIFKIPGLMVGQRLLAGVWAFSPKDINIRQNLLGDNVIEYFMPYQDNLNDCLYFPDNPKPEPYIHPDTNFSLACDSVMYADDVGL